MAKKYIDDDIQHIESDIEKVQTKPNMYISYIGSRGAFHLCKEVINNAIDECINEKSPGRCVSIFIDESDNTITVSDDGRGIPFDDVEKVCTYLQSGSKFYRDNGSSAGENGVGLTATNALSELFSITSIREGYKCVHRWIDGKFTGKPSKRKALSNKHGTTVTFKPSEHLLGSCQIPVDELYDWTEKMGYLIPSNITLEFSAQRKGKESIKIKKFKNKNGLQDYMKVISNKISVDPIRIREHTELVESHRDSTRNRFLELEVVFSYNTTASEEVGDSFCNFINTIDKGVHYDAVKQGITQFLAKCTRDKLTDREKKKIEIIPYDCSVGLILLINLLTDMQPHFASQTKEKLSNSELFRPIKRLIMNSLHDYFTKNEKELKKFTDIVKNNAKIRIKSNEARNSVIRGETNNLDEHSIKNFVPATNGKGEYKELFIIEGESAMGSGRNGRDPARQALFSLNGVPLNTFGLSTDKVLSNRGFNELVSILGCNIGSRFNIKKLKYDKIIIMSDADIDGYKIASLISVFFIYHLPTIVRAGKLYKAVTPLYSLRDRNSKFVLDMKEYASIFESNIKEFLIIKGERGQLRGKVLENFLYNNRNYLDTLYRTANHFAIHPQVLEYIVKYRNNKKFSNKITKVFPELKVKGDMISGIHDGKFQHIILDDIFEKSIKEIDILINKVNDGLYYDIHEYDGYVTKPVGTMSIGDIMNHCQKFSPKIKDRYKGLGSLEAEQLWETTMDPNRRQLIRLTIRDLEEDVKQFKVIHGSDSAERKAIMEFYKLDREELDN